MSWFKSNKNDSKCKLNKMHNLWASKYQNQYLPLLQEPNLKNQSNEANNEKFPMSFVCAKWEKNKNEKKKNKTK